VRPSKIENVEIDDCMIPWLGPGDPFPPVAAALRDPNGLLAAGGDLSTERLLDAYARGIFPWSGDGDPLLWWSPNPRMVLWLRELHVARSLRRRLRAGGYAVTLDTAFRDVMAGCAAPRDRHDGTWITPEMMDAYGRLAALGHAHSVEVWSHGTLAGGLYGVALGRMFYGESMFSRQPDGSKIALVFLVRQLERWGFELIDCQLSTAHLVSLGAREIPRAEFLRHVERLIGQPGVPAPWVLDEDLVRSL
jgi:leucyl/phenylalanyl-tRNA--protein transferase